MSYGNRQRVKSMQLWPPRRRGVWEKPNGAIFFLLHSCLSFVFQEDFSLLHMTILTQHTLTVPQFSAVWVICLFFVVVNTQALLTSFKEPETFLPLRFLFFWTLLFFKCRSIGLFLLGQMYWRNKANNTGVILMIMFCIVVTISNVFIWFWLNLFGNLLFNWKSHGASRTETEEEQPVKMNTPVRKSVLSVFVLY